MELNTTTIQFGDILESLIKTVTTSSNGVHLWSERTNVYTAPTKKQSRISTTKYTHQQSKNVVADEMYILENYIHFDVYKYTCVCVCVCAHKHDFVFN